MQSEYVYIYMISWLYMYILVFGKYYICIYRPIYSYIWFHDFIGMIVYMYIHI